MSSGTIFHNPRCSKSRQSLELLRHNGIEPAVINYLVEPPDRKTLKDLISKMGVRPRDILRTGEKIYKRLNLKEKLDDDDAVLDAMMNHPILIERPIVIVGDKVTIGRPPEKILDIIS